MEPQNHNLEMLCTRSTAPIWISSGQEILMISVQLRRTKTTVICKNLSRELARAPVESHRDPTTAWMSGSGISQSYALGGSARAFRDGIVTHSG